MPGRNKESAECTAPEVAIERAERGSYVLILLLPFARRIQVGSLGVIHFPKGVYLYMGSALGGLDARISRHARREKKLFWHIDYFLRHAQILDVWVCPDGRRRECQWTRAALALPNARVPAPRFGSSDCRCPSHLVHLAPKRARKGKPS